MPLLVKFITICSRLNQTESYFYLQEHIEPHLPLVLFGSVAFLGGLLLFFVPETLGNKLPDTVEEAEELGRVKATEIESTRL